MTVIQDQIPKCTNCACDVVTNENMILVNGIEVIVDGKSKRITGNMRFCDIYCLNTYIFRIGNGDDE